MTNYQMIVPCSVKHAIAQGWIVSLADATSRNENINKVSLKRALEFASIYIETGDNRYLGLTEDFLKDSLVV